MNKNLYRRYKISLITNEGITDTEKLIIEFVLDKIKDLTLFVDENGCHNYMNSNGKFIFEHDEKRDILWILYYDFWSVLEKMYLLKYSDIQYIIKIVVENTYSINIGMVKTKHHGIVHDVEASYLVIRNSKYIKKY
jgi:hypothetical protein